MIIIQTIGAAIMFTLMSMFSIQGMGKPLEPMTSSDHFAYLVNTVPTLF